MSILIVNARIVNEGRIIEGDVFIKGQFIEKIGNDLQSQVANKIIDAKGKILMPGAIDDQVHFREPGLTHKLPFYKNISLDDLTFIYNSGIYN